MMMMKCGADNRHIAGVPNNCTVAERSEASGRFGCHGNRC